MDRELPIEKKAFYNLLWMNQGAVYEEPVEPWQIEDFREKSLPALWKDLKTLVPESSESWFLEQSKPFASPEELFVKLYGATEEPDPKDHIFLLLFELWRRLLPEKRSLSISADDLDHLIVGFDVGVFENTAPLDQLINEFFALLTSAVDPMEFFETLSRHLANDLEGFLYDYLSYKIQEGDEENVRTKARLLEEYVSDPKWFLLLLAEIEGEEAPESAKESIANLLEESTSEPDFDFVMDVIAWAQEADHNDLFFQATSLALSLIHFESELIEVLFFMIAFAHLNGAEDIERELWAIQQVRSEIDSLTILTANDPIRSKVYSVLQELKSISDNLEDI